MTIDSQKNDSRFSLSLMLMAILMLFFYPKLSLSTVTQAPREAMEYFFQQSFNNLPEEAELAREEGKMGIFVMFNDPDCPWCKKMKATILNQVQVQDFFRQHFRLLHLDTRGDTLMTDFDGTELAEKDFSLLKHRVRATPVLMFFDLDGNVMLKYTGAVKDPQEFLLMGEFIVNGDYKKSRFAAYKRERLSKVSQ